MNDFAVYALYPNVVCMRGNTAYDKDGNEISLDEEAVNAKALAMEAEEQVTKQSSIMAKQAALNKLMALGLTEEEALALGK